MKQALIAILTFVVCASLAPINSANKSPYSFIMDQYIFMNKANCHYGVLLSEITYTNIDTTHWKAVQQACSRENVAELPGLLLQEQAPSSIGKVKYDPCYSPPKKHDFVAFSTSAFSDDDRHALIQCQIKGHYEDPAPVHVNFLLKRVKGALGWELVWTSHPKPKH